MRVLLVLALLLVLLVLALAVVGVADGVREDVRAGAERGGDRERERMTTPSRASNNLRDARPWPPTLRAVFPPADSNVTRNIGEIIRREPKFSLEHRVRSRGGYSFAQVTLALPLRVILYGFRGDGHEHVHLDAEALRSTLEETLDSHQPSFVHDGREAAGENLHFRSHISPTDVAFRVDYAVHHSTLGFLHRLEQFVAKRMVFAGIDPHTHVPIYDVDATDMDDLLLAQTADDRLMTTAATTMTMLDANEKANTTSSTNPRETVIVALLDKSRMRPTEPYAMPAAADASSSSTSSSTREVNHTDYIYRYRYANGAPSQQFLTRHSIVFIDLSAGPCAFGRAPEQPTNDSHSTSSSSSSSSFSSSFPSFRGLWQRATLPLEVSWDEKPVTTTTTTNNSPQMIRHASETLVSRLASIVTDSARHHFVPDVVYLGSTSHTDADTVIIPIIVFRNYRRGGLSFSDLDRDASDERSSKPSSSSPTAASTASAEANDVINMFELRRQVEGALLLPGQRVVFLPVVHELHEHHAVSMAVYRAFRESSRLEPRPSTSSHQRFAPVFTPYLDSASLLHDMLYSADAIVSRALNLHRVRVDDATVMAATASVVNDDDDGVDDSTSPSSSPSMLPNSLGRRVLPVFVFSLRGFPPETLFDGENVYASSPRAVLVLHTPASRVPLPFVSEGAAVYANARSPTRPILAGLAVSLASIAPPFSSPPPSSNPATTTHASPALQLFTESSHHLRSAFDAPEPSCMWSTGCLPFGPFATVAVLPSHVHRLTLRNAMLQRLGATARLIRRGASELRLFSVKLEQLLEKTESTISTTSTPTTTATTTMMSKPPLRRRERPPQFDLSSNTWVSDVTDRPLSIDELNRKHNDARIAAGDAPAPILISHKMVSELNEQLRAIEAQLRTLQADVARADLERAVADAQPLLARARAFRTYVTGRLREARAQLECFREGEDDDVYRDDPNRPTYVRESDFIESAYVPEGRKRDSAPSPVLVAVFAAALFVGGACAVWYVAGAIVAAMSFESRRGAQQRYRLVGSARS